jgi:uncharacterized repeat protein (TIGR03803 family)
LHHSGESKHNTQQFCPVIDREENMLKIFRIALVIGLMIGVGRAFGQVFSFNGTTVTNLYSFSGTSGGNYPYAGLVQGSDGNFYGTTLQGGTAFKGTVFRISPSGTYSNLYSFGGFPDGANPFAALVQGSDGNFYGTTMNGGTTSNGTVFRISPTGTYSNLHSFGNSPNAANPDAGLVQGNDGNFYGTTPFDGAIGKGAVFRISPTGTFSNLYYFGNSPDGQEPRSSLVQGSDGNFYGTTRFGGTTGNGTVFQISPSGSYSSLYSFGNPPDGGTPDAGLVQGSDGNFYGTTVNGGTVNIGTVFRISPSGSYSNLYSFGGFPNGYGPVAVLVQGSDGNFYGTTFFGGTNNAGTLFQISPSGSYSNLYTFGNSPDGGYPNAGLVQGSDGNFYGTCVYSGVNSVGYGTVFRLTLPLGPAPYPINQITRVQVAVTNIIFTIPSIAYETYQLQRSSSMASTNWVNVPSVSVTNSIGALMTLTNFGGANQPQGFFRFAITP